MIRLYSGTPGSGKSLHNARDVCNRSRFGRPVIGNFQCDLSRYKRADYTYVPNGKLKPKFLIEYSQNYFHGERIREGAILLVIDECQMLFNSREWQAKGRQEWLEFFTTHRHYGYDITLIAQFDRMIDRQIRSLIEYEYIHRKLSNFGIPGKIFSLLCGGNTFVCVQMWYPLRMKVSHEFFHARKSLYSIYDSYAIFSASSAEVHQTAENSENAMAAMLMSVPACVDPAASEPKKGKLSQVLSFLRGLPNLIKHLPFLLRYQGKFLRPGGRDEQGWKVPPQKTIFSAKDGEAVSQTQDLTSPVEFDPTE